MQHKLKVIDNFVWFIVNDKAKRLFATDLFELYILHDDNTESLINTNDELKSALSNGDLIGIEGDYLFNAKIITY